MNLSNFWVELSPDGMVLEDSMSGLHRNTSCLREEEVAAERAGCQQMTTPHLGASHKPCRDLEGIN